MSHDGRASFTTHAEDDEQETDDQGNFPSQLCPCLDRRQRGKKDQQILLLPFFPSHSLVFFISTFQMLCPTLSAALTTLFYVSNWNWSMTP